MRTLCFLLLLGLASAARAQEITRAEVLVVARSYAELSWPGAAENVRRGKDSAGVEVRTPSATEAATAQPGEWIIGQANVGMPYKWGGFDSLESFARGVRAGKAAGDLYNWSKRLHGDKAVSGDAVGVDCSGFISRCWKLPKKYGTANLPSLCTPLPSPAALQAGDIMNVAGGHVILFAAWLDDAQKDHARFYEAEPYSKVRASEYSTRELTDRGFRPWRYRLIKD